MSAALAGEDISFTAMEYRILKILTANMQTVLTRRILLEKLWDTDGNFVDEHALTCAISRIRAKIEAGSFQYIKTVYGMGYMWVGGLKKMKKVKFSINRICAVISTLLAFLFAAAAAFLYLLTDNSAAVYAILFLAVLVYAGIFSFYCHCPQKADCFFRYAVQTA